ncbi:MobA/MobL family protein [Psychrobacter sp. TAE2020]|uniref:MobA/MobL family protein n=1 Tax=Psychrobacter sp. TAE2020 TaxID=2846762 RepID=UPI001C10797D|nr:MobA/MobL family protein [Psychrobacter sp. TAE2020]MBU5618063.1 MobA/MobL family protein [Psychrobacter sp. TAE2020]
MAIVHIATKAISRKAGQSAVASAAYRAGVILKDERYDKSHDYSKKSGVMSADIILPTALKAKGLMVSREEIWNKAEHVEGRTDSRVAREWLINLPHELDEAKRKALAHEFTQVLADKYNIIADCAIHSPSKKEVARGADPRNYHAHILVTTREAKMGADGELFFDKQLKIPFEWSNDKRKTKGLQSSIKEIKDIRQLWVDMANKALVGLDVMELDARSFKAQGIDRLPTVKMGVDATNMERKGINTENGNKNRAIHVINQRREFTKQSNRKAADERHTVEYTEWATERVEWATNRHRQIDKRLDDSQQRIERIKRDTEWAVREDQAISKVIEGSSKRSGRNSRNAEWAVKRTERILRLVGTREPDLKTREESVAEFDQQAKAVNRLIADRANAVATAPSPFDDNARRARAASIAKEQREFDTAAENYDRKTRYYSGRIESVNKQIRHIRLGYAHKLLERHKEDNRLIVGWRESSDDYPNKYDYRQSDLLDAFADKFKLDKASSEDYREYHKRLGDTFDSPFFKENKAIMDLLRDPKAERDQYDAIKTHYDTFIEELDNRYKTIDSTMKNRLGNISDVSRRTAESLSAPSYLKELDNYINNEATADENKALAIKCKSDKINRTCQLLKNGMIGLKDIREADKRQTHSEALQVSSNNFMTSYGNELSNDEQKAINDGLSAVNQPVRSNTMSYKR